MAEETPQPTVALIPVPKPLSLIPVGLKEAALDSPTFRATAVHFGDQLDAVERWLDSYMKAASRLANEAMSFESFINMYLSFATPPPQVAETLMDQDYTGLAIKRYNDGAREFWTATMKWMKKVETTVAEPIRNFVQNDLANLRGLRRTMDLSQRTFDGLMSRYSSQSKAKEASSLREDAFQLHEARKAYLKASMDFCVMAPQVRASLDKLLVKIFSDRWRDMRGSHDALAGTLEKWAADLDRIRGWSIEMENNERIFKQEIQLARKQIEEAAQQAVRPSRELDDYAVSTVPYLGTSGPARPLKGSQVESAEKQGWLFQRTLTGKPTRTVWVRRWFYVKNGIFGYLTPSSRPAGVEESEKTGVLLCGVRPAFQEERRFCFEVKTKSTTIALQAETQSDLMEWITSFEVAKRKALENPASTEAIAAGAKSVDAAFAISPPIAPEFAAKTSEDRDETTIERSATLGVEPSPLGGLASRSSVDVSGRRSITGDRDGEGGRDTAARLMQKLDIGRKSTMGTTSGANPSSSPSSGIAGLISASHTALPMGVIAPSPNASAELKAVLSNRLPPSTLAPSTLAFPPSTTSLSRTAVVLGAERGLSLFVPGSDGGMPGALLANIWGTTNWGYVNRRERGEIRSADVSQAASQAASPKLSIEGLPAKERPSDTADITSAAGDLSLGHLSHRKAASLTMDLARLGVTSNIDDYPNYYPMALKAQDSQFRMLFPEVKRTERLVLVFRATWNPNEQQEFPGRVFVTTRDIYFYSNHLGLVLITSVSLSSITEVTAAPGKTCDFLFMHLRPGLRPEGASRVTVKTFLEPLRLLQRRLNYLVRHTGDDSSLEEVIKALIKMETGGVEDTPSMDSWEDISVNTPIDGNPRQTELRAGLRIDGTLYPDPSRQSLQRSATKFRLPPHPVVYVPQGMSKPAVEKDFNVTAKALFHVLAGDKSAVFQMLYGGDGIEHLMQCPWVQQDQGHLRREFRFQVQSGGSLSEVVDSQIIDVLNDHLCYVMTDRKTPWFLPSSESFSLISKVVITHVAKSRCRLAIYTKVDWNKAPFGKGLIEVEALANLHIHARSLVSILTEQVSQLGSHTNNNSRRAVQIFGQIGQQKQASQVSTEIGATLRKRSIYRKSLPELAVITARRSTVNVTLALLGLIIQMISSLITIASAHRLLVLGLGLSLGANAFLSGRASWGWWQERNASRFLARLGVGPQAVMGRSIWLKDIDEWATRVYGPEEIGFANSACAATFHKIVNQTDASYPLTVARPPPGASSTISTLRRLQKSRQNLGGYRHDLLVALRVVDRVEKEMLRSEWESWVWAESTRCRQVASLLGQQDQAEVDSLKSWLDGYCGSCLSEMQKLGLD
ncbi:hypothetical protein EJ06DRAFT_425649 [Trichodelitschia bisporula]|uniref:Transcription factor SipA3 n=1 Tax=Trichodelitschia bisporula TaxID=703511 RepID=A0A6G1HWV6_9PEZI|nr:hypothetical protein EJ06DRAFT_425649 [Trichodelitschia bisporula]